MECVLRMTNNLYLNVKRVWFDFGPLESFFIHHKHDFMSLFCASRSKNPISKVNKWDQLSPSQVNDLCEMNEKSVSTSSLLILNSSFKYLKIFIKNFNMNSYVFLARLPLRNGKIVFQSLLFTAIWGREVKIQKDGLQGCSVIG